MECRDFAERATLFTEGALEAEARRACEAHLAACDGCRAYLAQFELTAWALRALPPPEVPPGLQAALLAAFDARRAAGSARGRAGTPAWGAVLGIVGVLAAAVGLARHPSHVALDWAVAGALSLAAVSAAALARRLDLRFAATAISASLVASALQGGDGPLEASTGLHCLLTELGTALAVAGAAWLWERRAAPGTLGAWAVAGALAGDAALRITCSAHGSLPHLAVFHGVGLLLVAGAALLGGRRPAQAA